MYFVILGNILVHQNWQKANLNTLGHIWAVHKIRPKHVSSETIKINYSSICGWLPHSLLNILVSTPGSAPPWEMMILNQLCSAPERPCAWLRPMKCRPTGQTLLLSRASQSSAMRPPPPHRCSVVSDSLWPHGLYRPWNSPGQNTGVGCFSLLQGIFPTQGLTQVSCIAGGFFTRWATREAQECWPG